MDLKDAKLWADAYHESGNHIWVGAFLGCMYPACPTCYDNQTFNTMLNKTMGDLYRETERWIKRVKTCGYMYSIMWECQWDKICKTDVEVGGHVDNYSLADVQNPRLLLVVSLHQSDPLSDTFFCDIAVNHEIIKRACLSQQRALEEMHHRLICFSHNSASSCCFAADMPSMLIDVTANAGSDRDPCCWH